MQALITTPRAAGSTRTAAVPDPDRHSGGLLLRTLEVGVCGTDREIAAGEFGSAPPGETDLILGHELLGQVVEGGAGFAAGDLVTATVRRSCEHCAACAEGAPDACDTGEYTERGITDLQGFASELVVEDPEHLVAIPPALGRLGVLAEPSSICARGIRHATAIGERQPWEPARALVIGAGAIGMLATYMLRLAGHEVWTAARSEPESAKGRLVAASGARYVSTGETPLAAVREETGGFDVVIEAAGNAAIMVEAMAALRRNGVACLLGLDARPHRVELDATLLGRDFVIENRVVFGSVNAHRTDWTAAVAALEAMQARWPEAMEELVGLRVEPDRFSEAFDYRGVKATLLFSG
ncbi:MAG TPA: glucose 1-dehydrogenase [Solirubrobacteraceae bacterium]|nr:glucose 1-dehydrogenase [Solirubrobacteraceae bacterium]